MDMLIVEIVTFEGTSADDVMAAVWAMDGVATITRMDADVPVRYVPRTEPVALPVQAAFVLAGRPWDLAPPTRVRRFTQRP